MRSHWEQIKLADLFELQMGKTPAREKEQYWKNGTRKWVSIADISKFSRYTENTKESITDQAVSETGIRQVPANTIIMSFKLSLGKVAITSEPLYTNEAIMAFVDRKERPLSLSFLFHLFKNKDWSAGTNKAVLGMTLNKATLKEISIPVPPLSEQEDIAEKLDAVSRLITLREQQLQKLDQLASSRFIEMFGDPVANPKGWSIKKIKEVVAKQKNALKAGPFGSALKKEFYTPSGYKIYGQEQVINGDAEFGDYYISQEKYAELKSCAIQAKDVLISLVGTYGKTLVIPDEFEPGIINPRLIKITFDQSVINVSYFQAYFSSESLKAYLDVQTHGCTMGVLNLGIISNLLIPLPPLSLQNEFAAFIEQLDKSKVTIRKSIEKLETTYRALLQEYFG